MSPALQTFRDEFPNCWEWTQDSAEPWWFPAHWGLNFSLFLLLIWGWPCSTWFSFYTKESECQKEFSVALTEANLARSSWGLGCAMAAGSAPVWCKPLLTHTHTHMREGRAGQRRNKPHFNQNYVFTFLRASVRETKQMYFTLYTEFPHNRRTTQMLPKTRGRYCWKLCRYQSGRNKEEHTLLYYRQQQFAPAVANTVIQTDRGDQFYFLV